MELLKVFIQNFYSFKKASLDLSPYGGLTVIKGKNKDTGGSNGSGKSVLLEAIYFGLTGKTIRKSTEDALVNNQNKKQCKVELHLLHKENYIVISREKKPTKLQFLVGDTDLTKESVISTQKCIDDYFNTNYKVLLLSTFFGQANDINFLDCSADDKRAMIRNFLNLEDMFIMRDKIREHKSNFSSDVKTQKLIVEEHKRTLGSINKKIKILEGLKHEYEKFYTADILNSSLEDIIDLESEVRSAEFQISGIKKETNALEDRADYLVCLVGEGEVEQTEICDKCGNISIKKVTSVELDSWDQEIGEINSQLAKYKISLGSIEKNINRPPISSKEYSKVIEYNSLLKEEENFEDLREDINISISGAETSKTKSQRSYEIMRFWEKAFSEQGLIKYIINNILGYFNDKCNYYLSYLTTGKYFIEFDAELSEKILVGSDFVKYISMSGGEKRKINLAVLLALKDLLLLTEKTQLNLIFFDEISENLDEEGVQGLYALLQEIKKEKNAFVITHNKYLKTLLDSSSRISIIKSDGVSRLVKGK